MKSTTALSADRIQKRYGATAVMCLLPYFVAGLSCLILLTAFFDLRHRNLHYPINTPFRDALFEGMVVKTILQYGWYNLNPSLGAPYGMQLYDFPMSESFHVLLIKALGMFSHDWVFVMNVFYLGGYVLCTFSSLFVFLRMRLSAFVSVPASLLFAFLPYHYVRGEQHLFLSAYYLVPLIALVMLWIATGQELLSQSPGTLKYRVTREGAATVVICLAMGSGGVYYAFFAVVLLAVIACYTLICDRNLRRSAEALVCIVLICVALALNLTPCYAYWWTHGRNTAVATRSVAEADIYGLTISELVMPIINHRIPSLAHAAEFRLHGVFPFGTEQAAASLGIMGTAGFLILLSTSVLGAGIFTRQKLIRPLAVLNLAALLTALRGSFGSIFAQTVSPEIRCYARMSIYIAFFSLMALAAVVDLAGRSKLGNLGRLATGALILGGIFDSTPRVLPDLFTDVQSFDQHRAFISSVEASVPPGSMILQLPYAAFPEDGRISRMFEYDPFRAYLLSHNLRWSYGTMKGRIESWEEQLFASLPRRRLLKEAKSAGYAGVFIDHWGYADNGAAIVKQMSEVLREDPMDSADDRFSFLRIGPGDVPSPDRNETAEEDKSMQFPFLIVGCYDREQAGERAWNWCSQNGKILIQSFESQPRDAVLEMMFHTGYQHDSTLTLRGILTDSIAVNSAGKSYSKKITLRPGANLIELKSNEKPIVSADPRTLVFDIMNLTVKPL